MPDTTRTLLFGIFVVARRKLTSAQVIVLAKPLGISATNVKSHLSRMVAEGVLERSGPARRGQYGPSANVTPVIEGIAARLDQGPAEPWDRRWIFLTLKMPVDRKERGRLRASLWFDGFRPWNASTFVRPAWPKRWALSRARWYLDRIPGISVHGAVVTELPVSELYDLDGLDGEARRLARRLRGARIPKDSPARAFAARLQMGGLVARLVGHDPRLPKSIWGRRTSMRELKREFRRFERRIAPLAREFLKDVLQR